MTATAPIPLTALSYDKATRRLTGFVSDCGDYRNAFEVFNAFTVSEHGKKAVGCRVQSGKSDRSVIFLIRKQDWNEEETLSWELTPAHAEVLRDPSLAGLVLKLFND